MSKQILFLKLLLGTLNRQIGRVFFVVFTSLILTPVIFYTRVYARGKSLQPIRYLALMVVAVILLVGVGFNLSHPAKTAAATSSTINFQARLLTSAGAVVADGTYNVEFKIYNALTSTGSVQGSCSGDAACLWTEKYQNFSSQGVTVVNGYFSVSMGSITAFASTINWDQPMWLGMNIGGTSAVASPTYDGEMTPRLALTAVPYAFKAGQLALTTGANVSTLGFATQTTANNLLLPNEGGTLCVIGGATCLASGGFIQLQSASPGTLQTGNFNISGTGLLTALGSVAATNLAVTSGTTGSLTLDSGTSGAINVGINANAKTINIGAVGTTAAADSVLVATSTGAAQNIDIGGTGTASGTSNAGTTVAIQGGATSVNIANGGATVNTYTNSTSAFLVQNATTQSLLTVSTTTQRYVEVGNTTNPGSLLLNNSSPGAGLLFNGIYTDAAANAVTRYNGAAAQLNNDSLGLHLRVVNSTSTAGAAISTSSDALTVTQNSVGRVNISVNSTDNPDNLYNNGGFEYNCNNWNVGACTIDTTTPRTGLGDWTFTQSAATQGRDTGGSKLMAVNAGEQYYVEAYLRNTTGTTGNAGYYLYFTDKNGAFVAQTNNWSNPGTTYTKIFNTVTVPANAVYMSVTLTVRNDNTTAGQWFLDDFYLHKITTNSALNIKNSTDSSTAFLVQNAASANLLQVDTSSNVITLGGNNSGELSAWSTNTNVLSSGTYYGRSVVTNGYIYVIGGIATNTQAVVQYAKLNSDGSTGAWATLNSLPQAIGRGGVVATNGYIYVIGGDDVNAAQSTIYYAKVNSDGTLGSWITNSVALPTVLENHTSIAANGYLYIFGGSLTPAGAPITTIRYAKINADGSVGSWTTNTNPMTAALEAMDAAVANGYVYLTGGSTTNVSANAVNTVYYAKLNSDGSIGTWTTNTNNLPAATWGHGTVVANGYLYVVAGDNSAGTALNSAYYAKLNNTGGTGVWSTNVSTMPLGRMWPQVVTNNGYIYVLGGNNAGSGTTTIYYASSQRVLVGGSLDLVNLGGQTLADPGGGLGTGSTGGSILAGNGTFVGNLQVQGQSNFAQGVSVGGVLNASNTVAFQNTANSTTAFQVQNASAATNLVVDTQSGLVGVNVAAPTATLSVVGGISTSQLANPSAPTVTNQGTPLTTSYTYGITAMDGYGETAMSTTTTTTTGNSTLNSTNFNRITWPRVQGAYSYRVYRTASSGTPNTTGYIGSVLGSASALQLDDTGLAVIFASNPTINNTGSLQVVGGAMFKAATNNTTAFQIQSAASNSIINVDSTTPIGNTVINNGDLNYQNELVNPSFESVLGGTSNATGWNSVNSSGIVNDFTNAHTGNGVYEISGAASANVSASQKRITVLPGQVIYYEGWVKNSAGASGTAGFQLKFYDKDGGTAVTSTGDVQTLPGTTYVQRTNTYTVPAGKTYAEFDMLTGTTSSGTFYFDDVMLRVASQSSTSTTAFQLQNASAKAVLTADTANGQLILGASSAGGVNGTLQFLNSTNGNTVSIVSGATSGTYSLTLPLAGPAVSQCLQSDSVTASQLKFASCTGSVSTLQTDYNASLTPTTTPEILLDSTHFGLDIQDANTTIGATQALLNVRAPATGALGASLFAVNASGKIGINNGGTTTTPTLSYDLGFGQVTAGGGTRTLGVEAQATATQVGTGLTVSAGAGNTSGAGGVLTLQGGAGGATGTGGAVQISGGTPTAGAGGAVSINGASGVTAGFAGGAVTIATGSGGGGNGGSGAGGALSLSSSAGGNGTGASGVGAAGGAVTLQAGAGGNSSAAGSGAAAGGLITIQGGAGGTSAGAAGGAGSSINITAGNGGTGSTTGGSGGSITLTSGVVGTGGTPTPGSITVKNGTNSTTGFQVQNASNLSVLNVDTTIQTVKIRAGSDTKTSPGNLYPTNNFATDWGTTTGWTVAPTTQATHTSGTTTITNTTVAVTSGATYMVTFDLSGTCGVSGATLTAAFGGVTLSGAAIANTDCSGTNSYVVTTINTNKLSFAPTASWTGTISNVTIQQLTGTINPALVVTNSAGVSSIEVRASTDTTSLYVGLNAGVQSTSGFGNTGLGTNTLQNNVTGFNNTAVGYGNLTANVTGNNNTTLGTNNLYKNTSGGSNVAIGGALQANLTGNSNTAIGNSALNNQVYGDNNTAIGSYAGTSDSTFNFVTPTNLVNSTAVGAYAIAQASSSLILGGAAADAVNVGIGTSIPLNTFSVSPIDYNTGTACSVASSGSAVCSNTSTTFLFGTGTAWTGALVGDQVIFADGQTSKVSAVTSTTAITLTSTVNEATGAFYRFHHIGLQVTNTGNVGIGTASPGALLQLGATSGTAVGQLFVAGQIPTATKGATAALTGAANGVDVVGRYAYVVEPTSNKLHIYDVSNPGTPTTPPTMNGVGATTSNQPYDVQVLGHYAYVVEGTANKLEVFDISNPTTTAAAVGNVTTASNPTALFVSGKYAYVVATTAAVLQVFDISNPLLPVQVGTNMTLNNTPNSIFVSGRYAYVTQNTGSTFSIIDISNPAATTIVSSPTTGGGPNSIYVQGRYAYVAIDNSNSSQIFDISNPASVPAAVGTITTATNAVGITVQGRYAYITEKTKDMEVFDVSNPASPASLGSVGAGLTNNSGGQRTIKVIGRYAYIATNAAKNMNIYDLGGEYNQNLEVGSLETGGLQVNGDATFNNNANITGSLSVGQNVQIYNDLGVGGKTLLKNDVNSTTAFQVQNAAGTTLLNVNTTDSQLRFVTSSGVNNGQAGFRVDNANTSTTGLSPANYFESVTKPGSSATFNASYLNNVFDATPDSAAVAAVYSGDWIAGISQAHWLGSGNSSTGRIIGQDSKINVDPSSGSIAKGIANYAEIQNNTGTTITNGYDYYAGTVNGGAGTITNLYGFYSDNLSGGTNIYPLYMASATVGQPLLSLNNTGQFEIQNSTNSTAAFQVQNAAGTTLQGIDSSTTYAGELNTNTSFETNSTGWAGLATGSVLQTTAAAYSGTGALQITSGGANGGGAYAFAFTTATVYQVTFYARSSVASGTLTTINIGHTDSAVATDCLNLTGKTITATAWSRFTCTFTAATTTNVYIRDTSAVSHVFYIDAVSITTASTGSLSTGVFSSKSSLILNSGDGVNNTSYTNKLVVNTPYTAVTNTDVLITGSNSSNVPLTVQASPLTAATNANVFQAVNSSGVVTAGFTASGRGFFAASAPIDGITVLSASTGATGNTGLKIQSVGGQAVDVMAIQDNLGNNALSVSSALNVQIGVSTANTRAYNLIVNNYSNGATEPTGTNGAIYYNSAGIGGHGGASTSAGKFRCFEGNTWKNCIGMRDVVERRWGYAAIPGLATQFNTSGNLIMGSVVTAGTNSPQTDANYVNYATSTTINTANGIGSGAVAASCINTATQCPATTQLPTTTEARWLPKLVTRIKIDATAITTTRDWIALTGASLTLSDGTGNYLGVRYSTSGADTFFQCASGDGTTSSVVSTGVTVTIGHIYDIILDYSTSGTIVCSIADDGTTGAQGAFVTTTKGTNLPTTTTPLGLEISSTALAAAAARNIAVSYVYLESQ